MNGIPTVTGEPYLDFWHWVIENYNPHNGCFMTFSYAALSYDYAEHPEWVRTIYRNYLDEFANEPGELKMFVQW